MSKKIYSMWNNDIEHFDNSPIPTNNSFNPMVQPEFIAYQNAQTALQQAQTNVNLAQGLQIQAQTQLAQANQSLVQAQIQVTQANQELMKIKNKLDQNQTQQYGNNLINNVGTGITTLGNGIANALNSFGYGKNSSPK
jgi:hypothetical protein